MVLSKGLVLVDARLLALALMLSLGNGCSSRASGVKLFGIERTCVMCVSI
ncbi:MULTISPECIES: hypothetical protein [unclassified Microcoleus]